MKILAIGAHPDDIEFGAGAILLKEKLKGASIKMLILSKGESASNGTPEERERESKKSANLLGADLEFLDFGGDSHIQNTHENAFRIAKEIREYKPNVILTEQEIENQHPDHSSVGKMVRNACRYARYGGIKELIKLEPFQVECLFFYPGTPNLDARPDIFIDVSEVIEDFKKLIGFHETQMLTRRYPDLLITLSHYWGMTIGTEYAWGLYKNDPLVIDSLNSITQTSPKF